MAAFVRLPPEFTEAHIDFANRAQLRHVTARVFVS